MYYSAQKNALVFASELKCLLASGLVEVELDYAAIDAYLTLGYFPTPLTPLRHVHKLLAGHTLVVENGAVEHHPYWSYPTPTPTRACRSTSTPSACWRSSTNPSSCAS